MKILDRIKKTVTGVWNTFAKLHIAVKFGVLFFIIVGGWFFFTKFNYSVGQKPLYQTEQASMGTLVVATTASGQVSTTNNASINTQASGVVKTLYVKDGDMVKSGDKLLEIDLDMYARQKATQSLSSYQSAKNAFETAKANMFSTQSDMLTKWKTFYDLAVSGIYQNTDGSPRTAERQLPQFVISDDDWLATEAKYKIQQSVVSQTQTALNSSWMTYQQSSGTVYAPISGIVNGLSLQVGSVITSSLTSSDTSTTSQKIGNILTQAAPTVSVNLTEIDVPKIKVGDKATVTLDAYVDKTYTGKVVSIDTVGTTTSGVTNYTVVIQLDSQNNEILPKMAASASIITNTRDNVLLVPVSAVQTQNGSTFARVLQNGVLVQKPVETGEASETQIEIVSGLQAGDTVVTAVIQSNTSSILSSGGQSPFSAFGLGGFRGAAGGGARSGNNTPR